MYLSLQPGIYLFFGSRDLNQAGLNKPHHSANMAWHWFLAVQNRSVGDLVPWSVGWAPLTIRVTTTLQSDPRNLWPLRHLIRVIMRHDLTNKKTMTKTNTKTKTMTFKKHNQRAILEPCDLLYKWSEWWGHMTWPSKRQLLRQWQRQRQRQRQWQRHIHLENTFKEQS